MANRIEKCPHIDTKYMGKQDRGSYTFSTDTTTNCTITAWNDNRLVLSISSCDSTYPIGTANRWIHKEKKKLPVPQPNVIKTYNKFMGGVDRMDENISNYRISIRSKKWWWPIFAFSIDMSIHNAWQIYRRQKNCNKTDYLNFRREVVQIYLKKYGQSIKGGGRPKSSKPISGRTHEEVRYDGISHWMVPANKQNRCAECKKKFYKDV